MIFDKFCGIVEKHLPIAKIFLERTNLFHFNQPAHVMLKGFWESKSYYDVHDFIDNFIWPFDSIAVEDMATCMILTNGLKGAAGLNHGFLFIDVTDFKAEDYYYERPNLSENQKDTKKFLIENKMLMIRSGEINRVGAVTDIKGVNRLGMHVDVQKFVLANKSEIYDQTQTEQFIFEKDRITQECLDNINAVLGQIAYMNSPDRFILRETPVKPPKPGKSKKILRSNQRPIYTILKPDEIRLKMGLAEPGQTSTGTRKAPIGTDVRRHRRYLKHGKYRFDDNGVELKQKVIPTGEDRGKLYYKYTDIPAYWRGPDRVERNGKIYKVMLNL